MYLELAPPLHSPRVPAGRRMVASLAAVLLCCAAMLHLAGQVFGGGDSPPATTVVRPGDTLWTIAAQRFPGDDTRTRVDQLVQLNHLGSAQIYAGERLTLPSS